MENQLYFVTIVKKSNGDLVEKRVTDQEHLDCAVFYARHDHGSKCAYHVNKASMCFDGYLVNGDYVGDWTDKEINL